MAEKEEAGAPAEDDAVEAAPPADMMEVVFKSGKFGLKSIKVEADQDVLDVTLAIVGAIEDKKKSAVHEEFEPVDEDAEEEGAERKAKSATTLFVLTWENASSGPPINGKKDMGKSVPKRDGPLYVFEHDPTSEFCNDDITGNLTGFYPPAPGRKGFSAAGAKQRARKLTKRGAAGNESCMPDPEGASMMSRLYRVMTGHRRHKIAEAAPRRLRLKRKVKLVCKAVQCTPHDHAVETQTHWDNPSVHVQATQVTKDHGLQTGPYTTPEEERLREMNSALEDEVKNAEKLREDAVKEHEPCARILAKVERDLERSRNESGLADHGVVHMAVQTDAIARQHVRPSRTPLHPRHSPTQGPKHSPMHTPAVRGAEPKQAAAAAAARVPKLHTPTTTTDTETAPPQPSFLPEMPSFFSFWESPAPPAPHAAEPTPGAGVAPAMPVSGGPQTSIKRHEQSQLQPLNSHEHSQPDPELSPEWQDIYYGHSQPATTYSTPNAPAAAPAAPAPAAAPAAPAAPQAKDAPFRHTVSPPHAPAGAPQPIMAAGEPASVAAVSATGVTVVTVGNDDAAQREIRRLKAEIEELKNRPDALPSIQSFTYLFAPPKAEDQEKGQEKREKAQEKREGRSALPPASRTEKPARRKSAEKQKKEEKQGKKEEKRRESKVEAPTDSIFNFFGTVERGDDDEVRRLRAEVSELREALTMENQVLATLSSENETAASVKKALSSVKPRWQQEISPDNQIYFIDRRTRERHEHVSRHQLISDGAFLWAPFTEEDHKRDRLHLKLRADELQAEKDALSQQASMHEKQAHSLQQQLAAVKTELRLRQAAQADGKQLVGSGADERAARELEREQAQRRALEQKLKQSTDSLSAKSQEIQDLSRLNEALRSKAHVHQDRSAAALKNMEADLAVKEKQVKQLQIAVDSQNQTILQHVEVIEKAAKNASRATVDLEVLATISTIKSNLR